MPRRAPTKLAMPRLAMPRRLQLPMRRRKAARSNHSGLPMPRRTGSECPYPRYRSSWGWAIPTASTRPRDTTRVSGWWTSWRVGMAVPFAWSRASRRIFFFQAEDGIRDTSVTGVQTCALPIFRHSNRPLECLMENPPPPDAVQGLQFGLEIRNIVLCPLLDDRRVEAAELRDMKQRQIGRASCRERGENTLRMLDVPTQGIQQLR